MKQLVVRVLNHFLLPEILWDQNDKRVFEVLDHLDTADHLCYPNGRYLLKMPPNCGGQSIDGKEDSAWIPCEDCEVIS